MDGRTTRGSRGRVCAGPSFQLGTLWTRIANLRGACDFRDSTKVPVSRDLLPWPWPWAHPGCRLTWAPSCASLVAIRSFACERAGNYTIYTFNVIRFGVNEEPLRGYIVQYNYCGLQCKVRKNQDIASERSENRYLRWPHSHLTPLQQTPVNIHINLSLLETRIPGLQFCRWQCIAYIGSSSNLRTVFVRKPETPTH